MTRKKFKELTGEYPEDILGEDWENVIEEYLGEHPEIENPRLLK